MIVYENLQYNTEYGDAIWDECIREDFGVGRPSGRVEAGACFCEQAFDIARVDSARLLVFNVHW